MLPWILLVVVAAIAVAAIAAALVVRRERKRVEAELASSEESLAEARRSVEHLETRTATLRSELAEAHHGNAELTARLRRAQSGDARSLGLWALERHRQARVAGTPLVGSAIGPGIDVAGELHAAVALELELLREEVGTHAELVALTLGDPVDPREALAALRVVQELAATLAKRADELQVRIERDDDDAVVTVVAVGWNDPVPSQPALEQGVSALDGSLELSNGDGTLTAVARLDRPA
jgi:hypothetical protein